MLLKRVFFIFLLLGTLTLFVISALALNDFTDNGSSGNNGYGNIFQIALFVFLALMLLLSNIMYFTLNKTVYLLITLIVFLAFLNFFWIIIKHHLLVAGFYSIGGIFLVSLNYYILRNHFKSKKEK